MKTNLDMPLLTLAAIALCLTLAGRNLAAAEYNAQPITRIDFVAVEDLDIQAPLTPRLALNLSAGAGFPKMNRLNDYSSWINRTSAGSVDDVEYYAIYRVGLEYFLRPGLSLGVAYEFLDAETDGTTYFMGAGRHFEIDLETRGVVGFIRKSIYPLGARIPVAISGTASAGYYWSSYVETEPGYRASGDDGAWGAEAALGLWWSPCRHVAVGVEAGYRWLKFDGYGVNWVSPGTPNVEADYTGPTMRAVVSARF